MALSVKDKKKGRGPQWDRALFRARSEGVVRAVIQPDQWEQSGWRGGPLGQAPPNSGFTSRRNLPARELALRPDVAQGVDQAVDVSIAMDQ